jgi:transcriptional regulator with XRE-family HTH domain
MSRPNHPAVGRMVGARARTLREARGWSLSALASRAGIGKATLSEIEAGRRNPTLETLYAVAAQLEVPLTALLVGSDPPAGATDAADAAEAAGPAARDRTGDADGEPGPPSIAGEAVTATLVGTFADPAATTEVYRIAIRPGRTQLSPGHGRGVTELLLVTAGEVEAGPVAAPLRARAGQDLSWESSTRHLYRALGPEPALAVLIMRHPRS